MGGSPQAQVLNYFFFPPVFLTAFFTAFLAIVIVSSLLEYCYPAHQGY
jgi:hypothetical protein